MTYLLRALRAGYRFMQALRHVLSDAYSSYRIYRSLLSPERSTDERLRQSVKDAEAEARRRE